jgi:hypothetical protein
MQGEKIFVFKKIGFDYGKQIALSIQLIQLF